MPAQDAAQSASAPKPAAKPPQPETSEVEKKNQENLLGTTNAAAGESKRNENVQFDLLDNNAQKEAMRRLGTTATFVEEFQAERNYFGSEYGARATGPPHLKPNPVRGLHGSLFGHHQNSVFSARTFFQAGAVQPARENEYGLQLGAKAGHQTFYSLEMSQQKIRGVVNANVLVPKLSERTPLATDPAVRALVQRFLDAFPPVAPNRTDQSDRALNANAPQRIDTNLASGRADRQFGARDRVMARYALTQQVVHSFQIVAGQNPDTTTHSHAAQLTWNHSWQAKTLLDVSMGFERTRSLVAPANNSVGPTVDFGNVLTTLGPNPDTPVDRSQNLFRYAAQLRGTHGRHTWTLGAEASRRQVNSSEVTSHRGVVYFRNDFGRDALTNFRLGAPSRYSGAIGGIHRGFRNWEPQIFVGDRWRVSPVVTLDWSLRYQPSFAPHEVNHLTPINIPCDCNNVAPRLGIAFRLPGRWGVLRAAGAIDYSEILPVTYQQPRFNPPGVYKFEAQAADVLRPFGALDLAHPETLRTIIFLLGPKLVSPYSEQFNFTWQAALSKRWKLQTGYVGSRSRKLLLLWITNRAAVVPGIPLATATINDRRPDAAHFEVRRVINASRSSFDAARASLTVTDWRGLSLDASYWLSKAIDLGGGYTNTAAGDDARQGRSQSERLLLQDLKGLSYFDQPHAFLMRSTYQIPSASPRNRWTRNTIGGWSANAIVLLKSGTPFTVLSGSDGPGYGNVDGATGDRPNLIDPRVLGRVIGNPDTSTRMLPRPAFSYIQPGQERGNLGSNTFRKGSIRNVNFGISRVFSAGGDRSLLFRAESINFFNTPQFAEPGRELANSNFGQITNTLNEGRTFQFSLRLRF